MTDYRIFETDRFQKDLELMAKSGGAKVSEKLKGYVYPQLKTHPHYGPNIKKLKNYTPPTWRYRIGSWRFFYEIDDQENIVFMLGAHHRSQAYR
ncbi:type II toxin-antitoxin system RelE/ParE family toxin [uncultured Desulfosarcina sp.]|uniref:type II toxin-antitoxin system RelE family toxin n=1 Tax=uncultured Desulfosarcina sp. TaxID=218289 RepID=UPI0029C8C4BF|nr:type II toxin-antitoxin system RelE/ParE family toxin [uncultured Desulfosarcina sp.]